MATIIGCKPQVISVEGDAITLRIPGGEEGMSAFKEAIRVANLSDAEFRMEYDEEHGITAGKMAVADG